MFISDSHLYINRTTTFLKKSPRFTRPEFQVLNLVIVCNLTALHHNAFLILIRKMTILLTVEITSGHTLICIMTNNHLQLNDKIVILLLNSSIIKIKTKFSWQI